MKWLKNNIWWIYGLAIIWVVGTNIVFQVLNPGQTQLQAFLHLPKTVTLDFKP